MPMRLTGTVADIRRYPVKSMLGERLAQADVGERGLPADRAFGVLDVGRGSVLSAKREPLLFTCRARFIEGRPVVELPDGTETEPGERADELLSALIGRPARLVEASAFPEAILQGEIEDGEPSEWSAPPRTFFDKSPLHFVTTASLGRASELYPEGGFDARRFRPNFVVDTGDATGFVEESLVGEHVRIGEVVARVTEPCSRCVMTTHAQGDLARDPGILRTVARRNDNHLGVRAIVVAGGRVRLGDVVAGPP